MRVIARMGLLSAAAAAFVALTEAYAHWVPIQLPDARWQAERAQRPSTPEPGKFVEVIGEGAVVAVYAVAGRVLLRLRLSPVPPYQEQRLSLDLKKPT